MDTDDEGLWDDDEDLEEFLAEWDEADRQAARVLHNALPHLQSDPVPEPAVQEAATRLREGMSAGRWPYAYFVEGCGWHEVRPHNDVQLWREAAAATISPPNDPGTPIEEQSAVFALEHADWLGMVLGLVRRGTGARCSGELAATDIMDCPEVEHESEDPDAYDSVLGMAVTTLTALWQAIDILDDNERLTELGRWGLPLALYDVWMASDADLAEG